MKILAQIFCTKIGLFCVTMLLAFLFGILSQYWDWCWIAMWVSLVYPVVLLVIMMAYAFVINPLRERKETQKLKNENK